MLQLHHSSAEQTYLQQETLSGAGGIAQGSSMQGPGPAHALGIHMLSSSPNKQRQRQQQREQRRHHNTAKFVLASISPSAARQLFAEPPLVAGTAAILLSDTVSVSSSRAASRAIVSIIQVLNSILRCQTDQRSGCVEDPKLQHCCWTR